MDSRKSTERQERIAEDDRLRQAAAELGVELELGAVDDRLEQAADELGIELGSSAPTVRVWQQLTTGKIHRRSTCGVLRRTRYTPAAVELTEAELAAADKCRCCYPEAVAAKPEKVTAARCAKCGMLAHQPDQWCGGVV